MDPRNIFLAIALLLAMVGMPCASLADYPIVSQRYAADPTGIEFNGRLYLYCSNDDENDTNNYLMSSFTCFSTDDLKNWTDHGVVFSATNNTTWAGLAWAPSVVSNNSKLYLYFANGAGSIGVATSSVPTGPFVDAKGSALITSATPGAATATQWYFDPSAFIDDNGQPYLYFGGQYPTNARVILLNTNMTSVSGSATPMFATNFFEASYIHKRGGTYYYTYCNQFSAGAAIYCETNSNPTNGFVPQGTVLPNPPQNVNSNNHHSIVSFQGNWYIAYHNRAVALQNGLSNAAAGFKRSLCLDQLNYNTDGSIQQVTVTTNGLPQLKNLNPYARVEAETIAQQSGIKTEVCSEGGLDVTSIANGEWIRIRGVNFGTGATSFFARVASVAPGGSMELRLDTLAGIVAGTCFVPVTGGTQTWMTAACSVSSATGVHDLYLKFKGGTGTNLFNVNWWQFQTNTALTTPVHRYSFSETGGTNIADSIGGAPWTGTVTNGGTLANGQLTLASASSQYAKLPAGIVSTLTNFTITAWVNLNSAANWSRVFDFGNNTTTYMFLTPQNGGTSTVRFGITTNSAGGEQQINGALALSAGVWHHVAVTLSGSTGILYVDGAAVGTNNAMTLKPSSLGGTTNNYIGKSQWADPYLNGALDEFSIYNVALSADEISTTYALGAIQPRTATIDSTTTYQTIEGLGGATAFYIGWITAHPYKQEIYTNAFAGLNLSMLRLGNWFRYTNNLDTDGFEIVSNANRIEGRSVPVYMSSWAPPAFLKSNGQVGNGGTLATNSGGFVYTNFANYWYDSLAAYRSNGVSPTWISIQNEPDWAAGYDSCVFKPNEGVVNGTNYASYSKSLDATFQRITNLPSPPKILAPECVGLGYSAVQNYAATMNSNSFYGVAHHLYGGSTDGTPDGYLGTMSALTNVFPGKPRFMTEYGVSNMIEQANLIHNVLTVEQASGYNYWSLIWPGTSGGLIQIEFPWDQSQWTNAPPGTATQSHGWWLTPAYWAVKHFSYFIQPGYKRVSAAINTTNVLLSAYLSPDNLRLVAVFINRSTNSPATVAASFGSFPFNVSSVYQTSGTNYFESLGAMGGSQLTLPVSSLTTIVLDKYVVVGQATNPSPTNGATGIVLNATLSWTPGSNALTHAVYFGVSSNAVAQATVSSPEFQGVFSATNFSPALAAGSTYFWRVDEIAGINTNTGAVWSFASVAPSASFKLNASDALNATSFNASGNWVTNGTANAATTPPFPGASYNTGISTLRTPTTGDATFGGGPLTLSAGAPVDKGSLLLKGPNGATVTVNNLILSGGIIGHGVNSGASGILSVAGNINVVSNSTVSGTGTSSRYIGIAANVSGSASLSNDCYVIYSGNNTGFGGQLIVGSGSVLQVGSAANLGGPGAKLVFDGGTFLPLASVAINNLAGNVTLNSGGGNFQIGAGLTLTISNPITGAGNLMCFGGGAVQLAGANTAMGNLVVSNGTLALIGNAVFKNTQIGVSNTATLDVTALTVPLAISNRITLTGNLVAAVNQTGFTTLLTASNLTYGGTLTLSNLGPALAYGDTIKLFSAANYSGAFGSIVPAAPGAGLLWNTNWLSVDGTIFVTSTNPALITPPRFKGVQLVGGNLVVAGTNGNAPGTFFYTLASTNLALPLTNWTVLATNQFGSGGGFSFTNNYDSNKTRQFFILRLP